ncbi:MAG: hypothetical protein LBU03_00240 [Tannerellaceae bacterium]|jgi:hypothetical protein|nr:hypothetical protein [Tannerellaceae bacterium]
MKKVISVLWMLMLALAVSVNFTSCGNDDEPENKYEFLGSWEFDSEDDPYMVTFKEDGTYTYQEKAGTYTVASEKVTSDTGEEEKTVITCKNENYSEKFIFEKVSETDKGTELILYSFDENRIGEKLSFIKK